jgi:hypothetical protein
LDVTGTAASVIGVDTSTGTVAVDGETGTALMDSSTGGTTDLVVGSNVNDESFKSGAKELA